MKTFELCITMNFNPDIYKRRSIRLKGYDYSQAGLYFLTLCVKDKEHLFGKNEKGEMILNECGQMIERWYNKLPEKFTDIHCHEMVIMPNHLHCIIENIGFVGADPRVCPVSYPDAAASAEHSDKHGLGGHTGSPLHGVVQWFKTMTTNEYIRNVKNLRWPPFKGRLWQRNYYEHIIRNYQSYEKIAEYICKNPARWQEDMFYT